MEIKDIPISVLDSITRQDIEEYLSYISLYEKEGVEHSNTDRGKARKLSCLKTFYHYFFQNERISKIRRSLFRLRRDMKRQLSVWIPTR